MDAWVDGLPPSALGRIARQRESAVSGSLLSAPAAAALHAAGLAPVGEVFGCLAMHLGWVSSSCGWYGGAQGRTFWGSPAATSPVLTTGGRGGSGYAAYGPYVLAFSQGWHGALDRMLAEAAALGADGVVGVRMDRTHLSGPASEFSALGTAVRWTDRPAGPETARPWHTDLTAEDCAAALRAGLTPRGMVLGMSIATKHEDWQMRQQRSSWTGNIEVTGLTELITAAREDARAQVTRSAEAMSGGTLVVTAMTLSEYETACGKDEQDLHAQSVIVGTVLQESGTHRRPKRVDLLPVLPLTDATDRRSERRF